MKPKGGNFRKAVKGPKKPKKQIRVGDEVFTSEEEARYFVHLEKDPDVEKIVLQPTFLVLDKYPVRCGRCLGTGSHTRSEKTGNPLKCSLCKGTGERLGRKIEYIADFMVTYSSGYVEVVDVKGDRKQSDDPTFAIKKKLFEATTGMNLVVIRMPRAAAKPFVREDY